MALNKGVTVMATVRPIDDRNTYPTAYSSEIKGGYHIEETISDRNNIPYERRELGMVCRVLSDGVLYKLISNPANSVTTDSDWEKDKLDSESIILESNKTLDEVINSMQESISKRFIMFHMELDGVGPSVETTVPFDCTINEITLSAPIDSTLSSDIETNLEIYSGGKWNQSNIVTIASASASKSVTNSGLSISISKGTVIRFNITKIQSDINKLDASISVLLT